MSLHPVAAAPSPAEGGGQSTNTVRVSLAHLRGVGLSDGAWWPRTASLQAEIPDLDVAVHDLTGARIARAAYVTGLWDRAPHAVRTPLGVTKLGWFAHSGRSENIDLSLTDYTRLVLTVIPPSTDPVLAELILVECGEPTEAPTGADLEGGR